MGINGLILALAVCAAPSYGLAKKKKTLSEALAQLQGTKSAIQRKAAVEKSLSLKKNTNNTIRTQMGVLETKGEALEIKALQLQKEKLPLKEAIAEEEPKLETLNDELAAQGKDEIVPEPSTGINLILAQG